MKKLLVLTAALLVFASLGTPLALAAYGDSSTPAQVMGDDGGDCGGGG